MPRSIWRAVVFSFILQVAAIGLFHTYRFRTTDNHFAFGWEMGCLGKAVAEGRGFSDPFCVGTGLSAWEPPLYPYLIGGVFKLFGTYTFASAWILLTINSLFSALTCVPIYLIARKTLDERVASWSAWTWALFPYVWYWSIHWVWDTTISPFLLALIFLVTLELEDWDGVGGWALFGALWGLVGLANPSTLSFLPVSGLWAWHQRSRRENSILRENSKTGDSSLDLTAQARLQTARNDKIQRPHGTAKVVPSHFTISAPIFRQMLRSLGGVALASLIFFVLVGPWLVRNHDVFGKWVFIRNDFGQQFALGNGEAARGWSMVYQQPNLNPGELERFKEMGELAYAEARQQEAMTFIRGNPGRWIVLTFQKVFYYWGGIPKAADSPPVTAIKMSLFLLSSILAFWGAIRAIRQHRPGAWLFLLLLLVYPLIYYIVYPHARYRHPIEPELMILAVFAISEFRKARKARSGMAT
jgi:4-amino-4-deoxy-L-arabinose transferase-like glycosyltransferase